MKCPNDCGTPLVMSERRGVEIDYCPTCRGVWLDRGELDKIIERSAQLEEQAAMAAPAAAPQAAPPPPPPAYPQQPQVVTVPVGTHGSPHKYGQRRRRGMLGEIFDF